jgi:hypothetical protein
MARDALANHCPFTLCFSRGVLRSPCLRYRAGSQHGAAFGPIGADEITSCDRTMREGRRSSRASPYTVGTDNTPKIRFSATLEEEPAVEVALASPLRAGTLLTDSTKKECSSKLR